MILDLLKRRGALLALIFIAGWGAALKLENHGLTGKLARCQQGKALIVAAVKEADALAQAAREDEERRHAANAQRSNASHDQDQTRAAAAAQAYISGSYLAAHRIAAGGVRNETAGSAGSQALATAPDGSAGLPAEVPANPLVAVASSDLQTCTAAVTYAVAAHNWAATIDPPETEPAN